MITKARKWIMVASLMLSLLCVLLLIIALAQRRQ